MVTASGTSRPLPAYLGFAVFGSFWGVWGASIPAIRDQAGVSEGQLGAALLFVGAGALPAMLVSGSLVDRWGQRVAGLLLAVLGATGVLVAVAADDLATLSIGLAALGAASGAADVAINAVAGSVQHRTDRPVISRSHAAFSASVVVASLATGGLAAAGAPMAAAFVVLAGAAALAATVLIRTSPPAVPHEPSSAGAIRVPGYTRLLVVLGCLGALGFAVENGHQSWSALYLGDVLDAPPLAAAAGPAVFAGVVAVTRLTTGGLGTRWPVAVLVTGALVAGAGTATVGAATSVAVGLVGLALAAAGTGVLLPTLLTVLTGQVPERMRGRATSVVTGIAYLGFLAGPVYIGFWAEAVGLPGAMTALAGLAVTLAVLVPVAMRYGTRQRVLVPDHATGSAAP